MTGLDRPHVEMKHAPGRPLLSPGSPLHHAALWGLHVIVESLVIEHSQNARSRAFADKVTPFHLALRCGHVEVVRMLLTVSAVQSRQPRTKAGRYHWI